MGHEQAHLRPADVQMWRRGSDEAADVLAPEGEAAEAKAEATVEPEAELFPSGGRVATPVHGMALGSCVRRASPGQPVARCALGVADNGLVVQQRVQVVDLQAVAGMVARVDRSTLAEVGPERGHAHVEHWLQHPAIPGDRVRVAEVDDRCRPEEAVDEPRFAIGVAREISCRAPLLKEPAPRADVRDLP
jgi:hypothetical protein